MYSNLASNTWYEMKPLEMKKMPLPSFPVNSFPLVVRDYVLAVAEHTQTSVDMAAVVALGILATCNQKKFVVYDEYVEPVNLYTVLVAEPGERKSSVLQCFTKFLLAYQKEENKTRQRDINEYRIKKEMLENEIKRLKEPKKTECEDLEEILLEKIEELEKMEEIRPLRLFADDTSPEALVSLLEKNNGSMSLISSEGGIFDIIAGRYSNKPNLDVFLKGHSGDEIMVDRKGSESIAIYNPTLSFVLTIQPDLLQEVVGNQTMSGRGLLARFCYSIPKSTVGKRKYMGDKIPHFVSENFENLIQTLLSHEITPEPQQISLSIEAKERLERYFYYIEKLLNEEKIMRNWLAKHIGCVRRIAGNIHLASEDRYEKISLMTMERAIDIGKYFVAHANHSFVTLSGEEELNKAKEVLNIIATSFMQPMTRRDVFRNGGGRGMKKTEELIPVLDILEEYGYIKQVHAPISENSSKASDLVFLNPSYRI